MISVPTQEAAQHSGHPTPNIDRIAKEGAQFTSWYGQASCTAGRWDRVSAVLPADKINRLDPASRLGILRRRSPSERCIAISQTSKSGFALSALGGCQCQNEQNPRPEVPLCARSPCSSRDRTHQ